MDKKNLSKKKDPSKKKAKINNDQKTKSQPRSKITNSTGQ
jgi:hypothetical protein